MMSTLGPFMAFFIFRRNPQRNEHHPLSVMKIRDTSSSTLAAEKQEQCSAPGHICNGTKCPSLSDPVLYRLASQLGRASIEGGNTLKLSVANTEERTDNGKEGQDI